MNQVARKDEGFEMFRFEMIPEFAARPTAPPAELREQIRVLLKPADQIALRANDTAELVLEPVGYGFLSLTTARARYGL